MAVTSTVKTKTKKSNSKVTPKDKILGKSHKVTSSSSNKEKNASKAGSPKVVATKEREEKKSSGKNLKEKTNPVPSSKSKKSGEDGRSETSGPSKDGSNTKRPREDKSSDASVSPLKNAKYAKGTSIPAENVISSTAKKAKSIKKVTGEEEVAETQPVPLKSAMKKKDKNSRTTTETKVSQELTKESNTALTELGNENDNEEEGDEILLEGFSSESDSSDEDEDNDEKGIDLGKLPTIAKDDATVKSKLEKAKRVQTDECGVLYLGRIPHGFYEEEMKAYFSQFGDVTRLRVSRNKKTGRSKHYGFIEFASSAVAEIVAETMDNYLLMGHILRCKLIPKSEVHPELWVGSNKKFKRIPYNKLTAQRHNKVRTEDEQKKVEARLLRRQEERKRKLKAKGIEYNFDEVAYKKPKVSSTS